MMSTASIEYLGDLRTRCTHIRSGTDITTDAPVDNNGKGEAFSPTDLLSTSLAACMITTMGIRARHENIPFREAKAQMTKVMAANPRRVSEIVIEMQMPSDLTDEQRQILEDTALNCPVAKSLNPQIKQDIRFIY
jgi:putative redox protein